MKIRILLASVLAISTAAAYAADRSFERTLSVSSTPTVSVFTGSGFVHLHAGSDTQIHVNAHLRAGQGSLGSSDIDARMQQIASHPPIEQNGNSVTLGEHNNDSLYRNISIDYDISLPHASAITARTGSGEIAIQNAGVNVKAVTGSGSVNARGIHGPAMLQTGSGDITLDTAGSDETSVQTGSGTVRISGIAGSLHARSGSGDLIISGNPTADWKLQTGSGSINLDLGANARFTLDASTGSGSVHVAQPMLMQGSLDRHRVAGKVNGGGATLQAGTGSGNIVIR